MKIRGNFTASEKQELSMAIEDMTNPWSFEEYCGACDYFGTPRCPWRDQVTDRTRWKDLGCKNFWD